MYSISSSQLNSLSGTTVLHSSTSPYPCCCCQSLVGLHLESCCLLTFPIYGPTSNPQQRQEWSDTQLYNMQSFQTDCSKRLLLKVQHTDGCETSSRNDLYHRPQSPSPDNRVLHNASLSQFSKFLFISPSNSHFCFKYTSCHHSPISNIEDKTVYFKKKSLLVSKTK